MEPPSTGNWKLKNRHVKEFKNSETKKSLKACILLKSCESHYTCPWTPFIGRRRHFYIPKLPSDLRNMYMNVFYIPWFTELTSYIYKSATRSYLEPGLLTSHLWLGTFTAFAPHSRRSSDAQIPTSTPWDRRRSRVSRTAKISEVSVVLKRRTNLNSFSDLFAREWKVSEFSLHISYKS
jgi:hypothetical protein